MSGIVAIVGRPNVGKSTLFNRLIGERRAIVEDVPGITRDRLYGNVEWTGHHFTLIDTGGIEVDGDSDMSMQIRKQAEIAIAEADVIVFMADARDGLVRDDQEIADQLRRFQKPIILVVNKIDNIKQREAIYDFFSIGIGDPLELSALNGLNTGDLLDLIVDHLPQEETPEEDDDLLRISVIGKPNVGKSSLVNALLGEERVIVSDIPGTTRDAIDSYFEKEGKRYLLVDTAGMRRKSKIYVNVERFSVIRALRSVERCDVALMLLDASEEISEQDKRIVGYAHEQGKALILIFNKWDLVEKETNTLQKMIDDLRNELIFCQYAPVLSLSALTGQRVERVWEIIDNVAEQHAIRIATAGLNDWLQETMQLNPPPSDHGKITRIYFVNQVAVKPPTFVFFCNNAEQVHFSYRRFLENQLRATYGFEGTPLRLIFRDRERSSRS